MAFISNGTTVATGGSLQNVPAPSNSQILSGVASVSAGNIGCYALLCMESWAEENFGNTEAGSNLRSVSSQGAPNSGGTQSGTWRCMGRTLGNSGNSYNTTVWLRIS